MSYLLLPPIRLIVLIVGLPQLSETVYTPSLPAIAHALCTSDSMIEYTLTIYLFGFAIGTLIWGILSDRWGRKSCVLIGLLIFMSGCVGCYLSTDITALMISRFIQAFGGSIGSVLGQAICRDAFHGPALGKVYSVTGSALAFFPAIGPVIGGFIAEHFGWPCIFLFLLAFSMFLSVVVVFRLPETHHLRDRTSVPFRRVVLSLLKDKKVMGFGMIVAACNGISFSYFAEGSFYMIELLGLSPEQYGLSFIGIAVSSMLGGLVSRKLHNYYTSEIIMNLGLKIIFAGGGIFSGFILFYTFFPITPMWIIGNTILFQMILMFGICMATSNALASALANYKQCIGTASSFFGFFYYCLISLFTLGMGILHNGTLVPMPLYFFALGIFMLVIKKVMIRH